MGASAEGRRAAVERFFRALGELDPEAAAACVTEDYEGYAVDELPLADHERVYRGRAGISTWVREVAEGWGEFELEPPRVREFGDVTVVIGVYRARGQMTQFGMIEQSLPYVAVVRVRDGLVSSVHTYARYSDAVEAEGLTDPSEPVEERGAGNAVEDA